MKLRNKKTGEIHEITEVVPLHDMDKKFVIYSQTEGHNHAYRTLAELNEDWEDVSEEPKEYWCIDWTGGINHITVLDGVDEYEENKKEIGNYFSSREEAEKAVEKLKAWKRLKDSGFRFNGGDDACISYRIDSAKWNDKLDNDFDLLFGGEE